MKARVKATGEIVDVEKTILRGGECYMNITGEKIGSLYMKYELDFGFDCDYNPDYWTRLEHAYAGMAMQGILANIDLLLSLTKKKSDDYPAKYTVAEFAKDCAQALVEKMKEE